MDTFREAVELSPGAYPGAGLRRADIACSQAIDASSYGH